jgi:hypothetical protein
VKFKELLPTFIAGTPIKRKVWGGYWKMKNGMPTIFTKGGLIVPFSKVAESGDWGFTLANITEDDWEVATPENTEIAGEVKTAEHIDHLNAVGIISEEFYKATKGDN